MYTHACPISFSLLVSVVTPRLRAHVRYKNSPAAKAGLQKGDVILQWAMLQKGRTQIQRFGFQPAMQDGIGEAFLMSCKFEGVQQSISPLVRMSIGMVHELIVRREGAGDLKVRLTPERWSGSGLIGAILK